MTSRVEFDLFAVSFLWFVWAAGADLSLCLLPCLLEPSTEKPELGPVTPAPPERRLGVDTAGLGRAVPLWGCPQTSPGGRCVDTCCCRTDLFIGTCVLGAYTSMNSIAGDLHYSLSIVPSRC